MVSIKIYCIKNLSLFITHEDVLRAELIVPRVNINRSNYLERNLLMLNNYFKRVSPISN